MKKKIVIDTRFVRIRDLPECEQGPFEKWLAGQARPVIPWETRENQDAYYPHDYEQWKVGLSARGKVKACEQKIIRR